VTALTSSHPLSERAQYLVDLAFIAPVVRVRSPATASARTATAPRRVPYTTPSGVAHGASTPADAMSLTNTEGAGGPTPSGQTERTPGKRDPNAT
jgi:hypothetical protein